MHHALSCGIQFPGNNWVKKKRNICTQNKEKNTLWGQHFKQGCIWSPFSSTLDHRCSGLFSSFEMTHIFSLCTPPAALPLPWPVPKGSSAHGCQVSCILLKKHNTDVQGPKTMLDSSKQTCTCSHSERCGCIVQAQQLIWAADWTTGPVVCLPKSAGLLYQRQGGFLLSCKCSTQEGRLKSRFDSWVNTPPPWQPQY